MLEKFITEFLNNEKKYMRCIIAFIFALLTVQYGIISAIFIYLVSFIGYINGFPIIYEKIKNIYNEIRQKKSEEE